MSVPEKPVLLIDDEEQILISYSMILKTAGIDNVISIRDSSMVMDLLICSDCLNIQIICPAFQALNFLKLLKKTIPRFRLLS